MRDLLGDVAIEMDYLSSLPIISVGNIKESVEHLTEKYGNEQYFKQVFYAILSIQLNDERQ